MVSQIRTESANSQSDLGASAHRRAIEIVDTLLARRGPLLSCLTSEYRDQDILDLMLTAVYLDSLNAPAECSSPVRSFSKWLKKQVVNIRDQARANTIVHTAISPSPASVVFCPTDITHINAQIPAARKLNNLTHVFFANSPKTHMLLRAAGAGPIVSSVHWRDQYQVASQEVKRRKKAYNKRLRADGEVTVPILELRAARIVVNLLERAILSILYAERMIDKIRPDVLVVGNDLTVEGRAVARVAQKLAIPTLVLSHGSVLKHSTHGYHIADALTAYGDLQKQTLVELGTPAEKITVTGAPYLDSPPIQSGTPHETLRQRFGITAKTPWVLVATSGPGHVISSEQHQRTVQAVMHAGTQLPEVTFVVKLHRKDHPSYYRNLPQQLQGRFHVIRDGAAGFPRSIFDWLQGCPAVITGGSTVAIESMLVRVPVITVDLTNELASIPFIAAGATIHVQDQDALCRRLDQLIRRTEWPSDLDKNISRYLEMELGPLDGMASQRVAAIVEQLAASGKKK